MYNYNVLTNVFYYSVLEYRYSAILSESLNLGILFLFPNEKQFIFKHPKSLVRIKHAYPRFQPNFTQLQLEYFTEQAKKSDPEWFKGWRGQTFGRIVESNFLIKDSGTVLRFEHYGEKPHVVVRYHDDIEKMATDIYQTHFPHSIWGDNQ